MHEKYIRRAVLSAVEQVTDFSYEILVADDCSTDRTYEICEDLAAAFPDKVRLLQTTKNLGMDGNWRAVLAAARGKFVALLDGDDYWISPLKLQLQVDAMKSVADATASCHSVDLYLESSGTTASGATIGCLSEGEKHRRLWFFREWPGVRPATASMMYKASVIATALSERFESTRITEMILNFVAAESGAIVFLPQTMAIYRIHDGGWWSGETDLGRHTILLHQVGALLRCGNILDPELRNWVKTVWDHTLVKVAEFSDDWDMLEKALQDAAQGDWEEFSMNPWAIETACRVIVESRMKESRLRSSRSFRVGESIVSLGRKILHRQIL